MTSLEATVEALKNLSPVQLEQAASFIHQLKLEQQPDRSHALELAFGCLTRDEAEEMDRAIQINCERIDASDW